NFGTDEACLHQTLGQRSSSSIEFDVVEALTGADSKRIGQADCARERRSFDVDTRRCNERWRARRYGDRDDRAARLVRVVEHAGDGHTRKAALDVEELHLGCGLVETCARQLLPFAQTQRFDDLPALEVTTANLDGG